MNYKLIIESETLEEIKNFIDTATKKVVEKYVAVEGNFYDSETKVEELVKKTLEEQRSPIIPIPADNPTHFPHAHPATPVQSTEPVPAVTNEPSPSVDGDVDAEGFPWDGRIHSSNKAKTSKGVWKKRRGVNHTQINEVENEIKANQLYAPVVSKPAPVMSAPFAPVEIKRDFNGLMNQISKLFSTRQIQSDYPNTIIQRINEGFKTNIVTLSDISNSQPMVEYAWQCLDVDGKAI